MRILKPENFPYGIEEYLETVDNKKSITSKSLEEFVAQIQIKTGLDLNISTAIAKSFFAEIRNGMLRGDVVVLRDLGKFYVSSPKFSKNKKKIFPIFKPYKKMIKKLNDF